MEYSTNINPTEIAFEHIIEYTAKNDPIRSIKPIYKTNDFALYNEDSLEVMAKLPENYVDMIFAENLY